MLWGTRMGHVQHTFYFMSLLYASPSMVACQFDLCKFASIVSGHQRLDWYIFNNRGSLKTKWSYHRTAFRNPKVLTVYGRVGWCVYMALQCFPSPIHLDKASALKPNHRYAKDKASVIKETLMVLISDANSTDKHHVSFLTEDGSLEAVNSQLIFWQWQLSGETPTPPVTHSW